MNRLYLIEDDYILYRAFNNPKVFVDEIRKNHYPMLIAQTGYKNIKNIIPTKSWKLEQSTWKFNKWVLITKTVTQKHLDFVIQDWKLIIWVHHSDLAGWKNVTHAWELKIKDWVITEWTSGSWHFKPDVYWREEVWKAFEKLIWDNIWNKFKEYNMDYLGYLKTKAKSKKLKWNPSKYKLELNKNTKIVELQHYSATNNYKEVTTTLWPKNNVITKFNEDGNIDIKDYFRWNIDDKSYHTSNTVIDQFNLAYPNKNLKSYMKKITLNTIVNDNSKKLIADWFKNWRSQDYIGYNLLHTDELWRSVQWILKKTYNKDNIDDRISHFTVKDMTPNVKEVNKKVYTVEVILMK